MAETKHHVAQREARLQRAIGAIGGIAVTLDDAKRIALVVRSVAHHSFSLMAAESAITRTLGQRSAGPSDFVPLA